MTEKFKENINKPEKPEGLYRDDKKSFESGFEKIYSEIENSELAKLPDNCGRFHACYNNEVTEANIPVKNVKIKTGEGNYVFTDIKGKGHFVGVNYYINCYHIPEPNIQTNL